MGVMIDAAGNPEMSTLWIAGVEAGVYTPALTDWLAHAVFAPATQNGVPVRAEFKTKMKLTTTRH